LTFAVILCQRYQRHDSVGEEVSKASIDVLRGATALSWMITTRDIVMATMFVMRKIAFEWRVSDSCVSAQPCMI